MVFGANCCECSSEMKRAIWEELTKELSGLKPVLTAKDEKVDQAFE